MQNGAWRQIVQLEAIILQETSEERVDRKSNASQKEGNEAHPLLFRRIGEILARTSPTMEVNPARTEIRSVGGRYPCA